MYIKIIENGLSVYETIEVIELKDEKIEINVSNHAPIFKEIPNQTWDKNNKHILDLSNYVRDENNDSLVLGNTFVESIKVNVNNNLIEFVPDNDFIGTREIWFSANDSEIVTYSYKVVLEVKDTANLSTLKIYNITKFNITNVTIEENISILNETGLGEELIQSQAEIGKPVKWTKKIRLNKTINNLTVKLPTNVSNFKVSKIVDGVKEEVKKDRLKIKEVKQEKTLQNVLVNRFFVKETELFIEDNIKEVEIEYYTEPPQSVEKEITVYSDTHYTNILAYTTVNEA